MSCYKALWKIPSAVNMSSLTHDSFHWLNSVFLTCTTFGIAAPPPPPPKPVSLTETAPQSWPFIYTYVTSDSCWWARACAVFKQSNISLAFSPIIPDLQWCYAPVVDADVTEHCGEMSSGKCPIDWWNWRRAARLPHKLTVHAKRDV